MQMAETFSKVQIQCLTSGDPSVHPSIRPPGRLVDSDGGCLHALPGLRYRVAAAYMGSRYPSIPASARSSRDVSGAVFVRAGCGGLAEIGFVGLGVRLGW